MKHAESFTRKVSEFFHMLAFREDHEVWESEPLRAEINEDKLFSILQNGSLEALAVEIEMLRRNSDFNINALLKQTGQTLLHHAVMRAASEKAKRREALKGEDWSEMVGLLLDHGANPQAQNRFGFNALDLAVTMLATLAVHEMTGIMLMSGSDHPSRRYLTVPTAKTLDLLAQWEKHRDLSEDQRNDIAAIKSIFNAKFPDIMQRLTRHPLDVPLSN